MIDLERLRESDRDPLLRRMDWRFLLPQPDLGRTVCFAGGLLAEGVAALASEVLDPDAAESGDADLVVAADATPLELAKAQRRLCPGGLLYAEWRMPTAAWPGFVRRRLESAGFESIERYWVWPPPGRRRSWFWVPVGSPEVHRFLLATRPRARGLDRAARRMERAAWRRLMAAGSAWPLVTVAAKPGAASAATRPHSDLADASPPDRLRSLLLLTRGERSVNKLVTLLFAGGDPRPRLAVKQVRSFDAEEGLHREARALAALSPDGAAPPPGVPRLVRYDATPGHVRVVETALVGAPLFTLLGRVEYRELALRAARWLARLVEPGAPEEPRRYWAQHVGTVLDRFEREHQGVADPGLLRDTVRRLAGLGALPRCCEHRDFSPWNVHVAADGTLLALDWESAEPRGLPALDLFYFLGHLAIFHAGAKTRSEQRRCYRATLDPTTFTGGVHREALAAYAHAIGVEEAALLPLRLIVWPLHAHSEVRLLRADFGGRAPAAASLRGGLFLALWEEEVRAAQRAPSRVSTRASSSPFQFRTP